MAPGREKEWIARTTISANRPVIITFVILSTPFLRPKEHTPIPMRTDMTIKTTLSRGEESMDEKAALTSL